MRPAGVALTIPQRAASPAHLELADLRGAVELVHRQEVDHAGVRFLPRQSIFGRVEIGHGGSTVGFLELRSVHVPLIAVGRHDGDQIGFSSVGPRDAVGLAIVVDFEIGWHLREVSDGQLARSRRRRVQGRHRGVERAVVPAGVEARARSDVARIPVQRRVVPAGVQMSALSRSARCAPTIPSGCKPWVKPRDLVCSRTIPQRAFASAEL